MKLSAGNYRNSSTGVPQLSLDTQDEMLGEVFEYLQEWWKVHITQEDMKYVEFANNHETAAP